MAPPLIDWLRECGLERILLLLFFFSRDFRRTPLVAGAPEPCARQAVSCHRDDAAGRCADGRDEITVVHAGGEAACSRDCGEHERVRVPVLRGDQQRVLDGGRRGNGGEGRGAVPGCITGRHGACLIARRWTERGISTSRRGRSAWI